MRLSGGRSTIWDAGLVALEHGGRMEMDHRVKKSSERSEQRPQQQKTFEQRAESGRQEAFAGQAKFGKHGGIIREIAEQKHRLDE
jgi:hypothetical protein